MHEKKKSKGHACRPLEGCWLGRGGDGPRKARGPGTHPPSEQAFLGNLGPGMLPSSISSGLYPTQSPVTSCFSRKQREVCTFEEEVGLGQVQLVPEGDTCVLHPCAGLELHTHLQLEGPGQHTRVSLLGRTLRHASLGTPYPASQSPDGLTWSLALW